MKTLDSQRSSSPRQTLGVYLSIYAWDPQASRRKDSQSRVRKYGIDISRSSALDEGIIRERQAKAVKHPRKEKDRGELKLLREADRIKWRLLFLRDDERIITLE